MSGKEENKDWAAEFDLWVYGMSKIGVSKETHYHPLLQIADGMRTALAEKDRQIQGMVNKAADKHLAGYRELGAKCAACENKLDEKDKELARLREYKIEWELLIETAMNSKKYFDD